VTYLNSEAEAKPVVSAIEAMGGKAVTLQLDTGNVKTFDAFVVQVEQALQNTWEAEQFDFLINNAGISQNSLFAETAEEEFDRLLNINPGRATYASTKGAIEVLAQSLAKELEHRQITVNTVVLSGSSTEGSVVRDNPEINKMIASQTALDRVGEPDDIGGAITLLLSEENRWITGQRIEISGGQSL
jgi:NAD(P)-dependent dehydrogenase (short-subunit alcohol dehydrogenase family)